MPVPPVGACVYQCPFGAIMDKSDITQVIRLLLDSQDNTAYRVYAVAAPSMASQYPSAAPEKVAAASMPWDSTRWWRLPGARI